MMKTDGNNANIVTALATSLLLHLVAFGAASAVQSKVQNPVIREYIPVELVQLPSLPRSVAAAPAAPRRTVTPLPHQEAPAPDVPKKRQEPASLPVATPIASPPEPRAETSSAVSSLPARSAGAPGGGATSGAVTAPGSVTGTPQPQKRDKGSYQAFHRLTRLPSFRTRAEPVYPNTERMTGNEARVLAEIYLDEHGVVDDVTIKKSGGTRFDRAVIDAVRQSRFNPGYMGEKAVPTVIQIPYTFKLK
jgi:protein TonB